MSDKIKYEYKVQFMCNRGSWSDCKHTFTNVIDARVFKRRHEKNHKDLTLRIVRRPTEWEICE